MIIRYMNEEKILFKIIDPKLKRKNNTQQLLDSISNIFDQFDRADNTKFMKKYNKNSIVNEWMIELDRILNSNEVCSIFTLSFFFGIIN